MRMASKRRSIIGAYLEQPPEHLLAAVRGVHERARRYLPILLYRVTVARADDLIVTSAEIAALNAILGEDPDTVANDILALRSTHPREPSSVMALRDDDDED